MDHADSFFPRDAVVRRVVGERLIGSVFGARASFVGALHPVAMEGTSQSSAGRGRPFLRLGHTAEAFSRVLFGSTSEAEAEIARVGAMHAKVRGELAVDGGPAFPRGTSYRADDPEAAFWTLAVLADSAETLYERLVRPLRPDEREAYWADMRRFGIAFGLPESAAPTSHAAYRETYEGIIHSGRLHLTTTGYHAGMNVALKAPLPVFAAPARDVFHLLIVGTVPDVVRQAYGVEWTRSHRAGLAAFCAAYRQGRRLVPRVVRRGSYRPFVDVVVREERRRLRTGRPVWGPAASARGVDGTRAAS